MCSDQRVGVRSRFAPSPTGELHLGSARTALFAWLYARHHGGTFLLRIEDTDRERSSEASVKAILEAMEWMGLDIDEGPFYQTDRLGRYRDVIDQLLEEGKAYRCYCSKERLEALRDQQMQAKEKPRYDGHCRHLVLPDNGHPSVIRFKNPTEGLVEFDDQIKGRIRIANSELDDLIIARSDGTPTYNFCVVIDDRDMGITEVIRGDDHINNTPRQINIFKALGATPPSYAHVTTILGEDGKRLSKRKGAMGVLDYREAGYLPEALVNYVLRLGFSYGDQELFSREEMITCFSPGRINRSPAQFNPNKLLWLNQHYMKNLPVSHWLPALKEQFLKLGISLDQGPDLEAVAGLQVERCKTLQEIAEKSRYFYEPVTEYEEKDVQKHLGKESRPVLEDVKAVLLDCAWEVPMIHAALSRVSEKLEVGLGKVAQPLRVVLTGSSVSPPIDQTLFLLGKETALQRIDEVLLARGSFCSP